MNHSLRESGRVLLVSCYELGRQPLGVALPSGFLRRAGFQPHALDVAVEMFDEEKAARADFIGISVPMHTAMRLGVRVIERIREINPACRICCYGLYAALNSDYLLEHGADFCIGGECETPLTELVESLERGSTETIPGVVSKDQRAEPHLEKLRFAVPDRNELPLLDQYAHLEHNGESRPAGHVEATRGCLHLCTHCPIP
ncbi:MAG: cobalamin-dependent protein, partial [Planctomycetales bacterium]